MKQAQRACTAWDPTVRTWHPGLTLDCQLFTIVLGLWHQQIQFADGTAKAQRSGDHFGLELQGRGASWRTQDWPRGKRGRSVRGGPPLQEQNLVWPS